MSPGLSANRPNAITAWIAEQIAKLGGGRTAVTPTVTSQRAPTVAPSYGFAPTPGTTMSPAYSPARAGSLPAPPSSLPQFAGPPAPGANSGEMTMEDLMSLLGMAGLGGGTDNSLGWANLDLQREQMAQQAQQFAASLAQAAEIERQRREQQQREMAAAMGQFLAGQQSQNWNNALPYRLPSGTQYAPGFEPGGAANRLAQIAQAAYTAPKLAVSNPPSRGDMEKWLEDAIKRFGPQ